MSEFQHHKLEPNELRATSEALWGNPVYGDVAERWLETHMYSASYGLACEVLEGQYNVSMGFNPATKIARGKGFILQAARDVMPLSPYLLTYRKPEFETPSFIERRQGTVAYVISPVAVGTRQLSTYVRGHQYDRHIFHGSYGKALDVLGVVSNVRQPEDIDLTRYDEPFVSFADLQDLLVKSATSPVQQRDTLAKIRAAAYLQARDGTVAQGGEIVFEGDVKPSRRRLALTSYEYVAYSSLVTIANRCRPNNPMRDFLHETFGIS